MNFLSNTKYNSLAIYNARPFFDKSLDVNPYVLAGSKHVVRLASKSIDRLPYNDFYGHYSCTCLKNGLSLENLGASPDEDFYLDLWTAFYNNYEAYLFAVLQNNECTANKVFRVFSSQAPNAISYEDALLYLKTNENAKMYAGTDILIPEECYSKVVYVDGKYDSRDAISGIEDSYNFLDTKKFILMKDKDGVLFNIEYVKTPEQKLAEILQINAWEVFPEFGFSYYTYDLNPASITAWIVGRFKYEVLYNNFFVGSVE